MRKVIVVALAVVCVTVSSTAAPATRQVELRIVPPQRVAAIAIRSGESTRSVEVRNGKATVPADLPLPWSLGMVRFEADAYTSADLDAKRPWIVRELGVLRGRVERPPASTENFTLLLERGGSEKVQTSELAAGKGGQFDTRVPAGIWHGALVGHDWGTRMRSGIVIKPGEVTDIGVLGGAAAVPVSVRVLDDDGRSPIAGARVVWDPPGEMVNSALSRRLYAHHWSAVTDRRGIAVIRAVGPLPHSARWLVEAEGYAGTRSASVFLKEPARFALPDVMLRPEPVVNVRVHFPQEEADALRNASLVAGENRDPRTDDVVAVHRVKLKEGETQFKFTSYGRKRVWVESSEKKKRVWEKGEARKLLVQDLEVTAPITKIDVALRPVEINGRVTQGSRGVAGTLVVLTGLRAGTDFLAEAEADDEGRFRFTTWATGKVNVYTIAPRAGAGRKIGRAYQTIDLTDRDEVTLDLEIPSAGFTLSIVDSETGAPVRARVDVRSRFNDGKGSTGMESTDEEGRIELSGYPEGTAKVNVAAPGYRSAQLEMQIRKAAPEQEVRLRPARPVTGRIVDIHGAGIPGAQIVGGFVDDREYQSFHETNTDGHGRFRFDSAPPADLTFYVIAGGFALGTTTLSEDRETVVTLHPPSSSIVTLRQDHKPPEKVWMVTAAPAGQKIIHIAVLEEMAARNGMTFYQLCGTSVTGDVVLPEFLGPGTYELYLARYSGNLLQYQNAGAITTPLVRNTILSVDSQ